MRREWMRLAVVLALMGGSAAAQPAPAPWVPTTRPAPGPGTIRTVAPTTRPGLEAGTLPSPGPTTQPGAARLLPLSTTELSPEARVDIVGDKIIISGTEDDIRLIESLIAAMEDVGPEMDIEIFPLRNAQAQSVAPTIQRIWNELRQGRPQTPADSVSIAADALSNTIIVGASRPNIERIGKLIEQIENAPSPIGKQPDWTPVQLKHIRASEAAEIVRQTLEKLQKRTGMTGTIVDVQVDPRQNSLLIIAPQKDIEQIHKLIEIIDRPPSTEFGGAARLAIFPLLKGSAETVAKTLQDMITLEGPQRQAAVEQVRRLRMTKIQKGGQPEELPDLDLEKPIKIIADAGTNSVIVGTTEKNIAPLSALIELLDSVPTSEQMMVRIFALKNADAQNMADVLTKIFQQGKDLPDVPGKGSIERVPPDPAGAAMAYNVNISVDPRTNMLIVAGRAEQIALAQRLVEEMDIEGIGVKFPVQVLHVEHADPDRMVEIIEKLTQQRIETLRNRGVKTTDMERVFIVADPRTDSLIVSATEENIREIRSILQQLDRKGVDFLGDVHILTLRNLTAADLGPKIEQLWQRRADLKTKRGETYDDMPVIVTDPRSNALVIASNKEDFAAIQSLIQQLEDQPLAPSAAIHVHPLRHNDASKLGQQLQSLFRERAQMRLAKGQEEQISDRITIVADALTNTLLIASSRELYGEVVQLLAQLDVPLEVTGLVRMFPLQHADATRAASLIQELFQKGIMRPAGTSQVPESQRNVSIIPDGRTNTLIVSATPENFAIVENLLRQIDSPEPPVFTPETRIFDLQFADAVRAAGMLEDLFEGIRRNLPDTEARELQMTFIPDDRSNTLIVTGSRYGVRRAEELLSKIDRAPGTPSGVTEVYTLQYGSAGRLADMLTEMFEKRKATGQQREATPIHILGDDQSNSLIVTASREEQGLVKDLLARLDRPSAVSQQLQILPLAKARADQIVDTLTDLLQKQAGAGGGAQRPSFSVSAEPRTNSLIVFAGPDMMNNIRAIVERLDTTDPTIEMGMRVIRLKQARAEDLAERLNEFLQEATRGGQGGGRGGEQSSIIINFKAYDPEQQKEVLRKLVHQDITITAEPRTNSLMIMAPRDSVEMLEQLVEMLDQIKPLTAEILMFPLQNADAEETQKLLEELFQTERQAGGRGTTGQPERRLIFAGEGAAPAGGEGGAVTELSFSVDRRTNTLIAAGSPEYLEIVERVVYQLDYLDLQNRQQRIVKLRNAVATNVAATLEQYFQQEEQALETGDTEESILRRLERQVTVQADEDSNTLILSYNHRMEPQIVEMINKLDQAPPQVMIQVLLAEVTLDDRMELGMEFALQDLLFTEHATVGPNNTIQGDNFDFVAGTDVGASGSGTGFNFTITGEDFNFLFHALQGEGRVEVLSRPSIMVADNQEANITVGESIPIVKSVVVSTGGVVQPSVDYQDVGIILDVEPHINPDGYVNLHITPEISSIAQSSVSVGSGITLPILTQRSADTWVTVRDGETIVIGGLITSRVNEGETKVPIAGDIPLLGNLFRATTRTNTKTELLIVLTPKVIRTEEDAQRISVEARDQTGLLERIRISPLMEKLQVKPGDDKLSPAGPATRPAGVYGPNETPPVYGPPLDVYGPDARALGISVDVAASKR